MVFWKIPNFVLRYLATFCPTCPYIIQKRKKYITVFVSFDRKFGQFMNHLDEKEMLPFVPYEVLFRPFFLERARTTKGGRQRAKKGEKIIMSDLALEIFFTLSLLKMNIYEKMLNLHSAAPQGTMYDLFTS